MNKSPSNYLCLLKQARPEKVHVVWFHSYEQMSRKWEIHYSEKTGGREGGSITKAVNKPAGTAVCDAGTALQWGPNGILCASYLLHRHQPHLSEVMRKQNGRVCTRNISEEKNTSSDEFTEISRENPLRMDNLESLQGQ